MTHALCSSDHGFLVSQQPQLQGSRAIQLLFNYVVDGRRAPPPDHITETGIKIRENLGKQLF